METEVYKSPHLGAGPGLIKYKGVWYPQIFLKLETDKLEKMEKFEARPDDIWLCSYPKSGTSWLQQIIYYLVRGFNDKATQHLNADEKVPYIEGIVPVMDQLNTAPSPRIMKTHFPLHAIPESVMANRAKVVYIGRNVKDVSVSDFHFHKLVSNIDYKGTFQDFYQEFKQGKLCYSSWWDHVSGFWNVRNEPNVWFMTYEQLHQDPKAEIRKLAEFLQTPCSEDKLHEILAKTTFKVMKDDPMVNHEWHVKMGVLKEHGDTKFMRKGQVGDWINYYTEEMSQEIDDMCQLITEPLGLHFTCVLN